MIRRGEPWGGTGPLPSDGLIATDDAAAAAIVTDARRRGEDPPPVGLLGGDLCRTLGGLGDRRRLDSEDATRVTVDIGSVLLDGRLHWFVAHLVARRSWWHGRVFAAMNAQWLGRWNAAPRAHPGDGRLDTIDATLGVGDRLKARRRLADGSHVPHPDISERRVTAVQVELDPAAPVRLDGARLPPARALSIRVEAAALQVVV